MRIKDGEQLAASGTRSAFGGLSDALVAEGHPEILVVSGDRDPAYQERIWYERMVPVSQVGGRRTYGGVKWWRGVSWIRVSSAGDVAVPRTSQHEAKRAADLAWPYNNRYTLAHARCVQLAPRFGIEWTGRNFGEDWHFENRGPLGSTGTPTGGREEDEMNDNDKDWMRKAVREELGGALNLYLGSRSDGGVTPLIVKDQWGYTHKCILGDKTFRHLIETDQPDWVRNVFVANDAWVEATVENLPVLLRSRGCDLDIFKIMKKGEGTTMIVLDPLDRKFKEGAVWTAENVNRALLTKLLKA